jgi:hypothetical protein
MEPRFSDNGDGTLTDRCTGLMWTKTAAPDRMTWQQALQYCDRLTLYNDGTWSTSELIPEEHFGVKYDDWRLPNISELQSLCRFDRQWSPYSAFGPAFDLPIPDPNTLRDWWYWSSTTFVYSLDYAWVVGYMGGSTSYSNGRGRKNNPAYRAIAVRGGL